MTESKQEFMVRVAEATRAMPYAVTETPDGFDVRTDLADATWLAMLRDKKVLKAHLHRVAVEGMVFRITSDSRDLAWGSGAPVLATPKEVRTASRGGRGTVVASPDVSPDQDDVHTFEAGRRIIVSAGEELGLAHKQTGRRVEVAITAVAIIAVVVASFAVASWVLFFR